MDYYHGEQHTNENLKELAIL